MEISTSEEEILGNRKRKKGHRNTFKYKASIIKKSRVEGTSYTTWRGKVIPELKPGDDCKCRNQCYIKISEDERKLIYSKFRSFGTKNEQDIYLQSLISTASVKRRRPRKLPEETSKTLRGVTYVYEISTCSGIYKVCKTAFMNIHAISSERIRRLCNLLSQGKSPIDKRGQCIPGNAKPGYMIDAVKEHIASFPVKIAHYTSREFHYLSEKLNIKLMHSMFKTKYPEMTVTYDFYRKIFKKNFSLFFGRPQDDTCCTCEELGLKIKSIKSTFLNETAKRPRCKSGSHAPS